MKKENRVKVTHTNEQWRHIEASLASTGVKNMQIHIRKELAKIDRKSVGIEAVSDCDGCMDKQQKIFWLTDSSKAIIERIKSKTGITEGGMIISRLITVPLLVKKWKDSKPGAAAH